MFKKLLMFSMLSIVAAPARAQDSPLAWAARLETEYRIVPDITYLTASNYAAKLDLHVTRTADKPLPTLIWIHGGGWTGGVKESATSIPAYLAMGLNVVNVEYRVAGTALAPAAVEDCRCALRWVI
jgi:acetyl esterase/lipase